MHQLGQPISIQDVFDVAHGKKVALNDREKIRASRRRVERLLAENRTIYGINTGFGRLSNVSIPADEIEQLQRNLILSHAVGVGEFLSKEVVRAMMFLRAQSLALGLSGVREELIDLLVNCLNANVHPLVPAQGSVGASGDLAPLAHMSLLLIGEGQAELNGEILPAAKALDQVGLKPLKLAAKEGLALINGTQAMTAISALTIYKALQLAKTADVAAAMSLEALSGNLDAFSELVTEARPHPGAIKVAKNIRELTKNSQRKAKRLQDAYSLRCVPQVHGASKDALDHVYSVLTHEINSVTDNPLIFSDSKVISAGNFHGQPVALAMDYAKIALSELANISERRIQYLLDSNQSNLPPFLIEQSGLNSGLMIIQYAAASLVSENKVLSHPASVDSIPTSANQEDHVSMGTIAARQAEMILKNAQTVIAIELICATQALEFGEKDPGNGVQTAYQIVRSHIPQLESDRLMIDDINEAKKLVVNGVLADLLPI